jgi:fimbrial chaperone protein
VNKIFTVTALALGLLMQAGRSSASAFRVTPVTMDLSQKTPSALFTLINESDQDLRFQMSVFSWSQQTNGEMKLDPTQDITFFPSLLTLKKGEERKVRVGTKVFAGDLEKTYRIFFEELPPLNTPVATATQGAQVRILTKMGIPIFIAPTKSKYEVAVDAPALSSGKVKFAVHNGGNTHFSLSGVNVTALAADGTRLFEKKLDGWYVLPATPRLYELQIPASACSKTRRIEVVAQTDLLDPASATVKAAVDVSQPSCVAK